MIITVLTLIIGILILFSILWSTYKNGISPMPTSSKVKKDLLKLLPPSLSGPVYELGGGWGTLSFSVAKKYPSNRVIVFENSLVPFIFCKMAKLFYRTPNLQFLFRDFYSESIHDASLVICYLYPEAMQKLKLKFENELFPHTCVISHTFAIPGWVPDVIFYVNDLYQTPIYIYKM